LRRRIDCLLPKGSSTWETSDVQMASKKGYTIDNSRLKRDLTNCDLCLDELQKAYGDREETSRVLPMFLHWICITDSDLTVLCGKENGANEYLEQRNRRSDGCGVICALKTLYDESRHGDSLFTSKGVGLSFGPEGKGLVFPLNFGGEVISADEIAASYTRRGEQSRLTDCALSNYREHLDGKSPIAAAHEAMRWIHSFVDDNLLHN